MSQPAAKALSGGSSYYTPPTGPMHLGEAPIYRSSDHTLHWLDVLSTPSVLHVLSLPSSPPPSPSSTLPLAAGTKAKALPLPESVSVAYFRANRKGSYICAYYAGIAFLDEETGELEVLREIIPSEERGLRRFNDGGVDAKGRFWAAEIDILATTYPLGQLPSSYGPPRGRLWRYDPDGSLHEMASGLICGNGVEWSPDNKTFYLNDSMGQKTYAYDFDLESGDISNKRVLIDYAGTNGEPDGLVVDSAGNLYTAVYGTNTVRIHTPSGLHLQTITFTAKNLTCPTWGEPDLGTLYVTSGRRELDNPADEGGAVFACRIEMGDGVRGVGKREFAG